MSANQAREPLHFKHWPPGLPRTLPLPETSLWANLEVSALRYPDKPAIHFYGKALSYRDLLREATVLAGFLQHRCKVARGDRVLLYLQNSPQFVIGFQAALRADTAIVPVSPMCVAEELSRFVGDSGARAAIVGQELLDRVEPLIGRGLLDHVIVAAYGEYASSDFDLPLPEAVRTPARNTLPEHCIAWTGALRADLAPGPHLAQPDDLAVLPYTSGTTGEPKGCIHTHRTVMATTVGASSWFGNTAGGVALAALPLFHVTGMLGGMLAPIWTGQTVVLMQRWDREVAAALIERHRVTSWRSIATMLIDFFALPGIERRDLSSLVSVGGGGAAIPVAVGERLREVTGLECVEGYGLTETMAPSHYNPPHRPKRQCLGVPLFGVDSRIIDPDTGAELPQGEVGEIVMRGPQIFLGYWNRDEATRDAFVEIDGERYFRSGDIGHVDEDGYFFMADRLKRMINASGMKVWPAEVEAVMHGHPDILECCVVGARDAYRGETVKAVVVLKPGHRATPDEVTSWCRERMAAYKIPRVIEFAEALPKSATGKVQWRLLQERSRDEPSVVSR